MNRMNFTGWLDRKRIDAVEVYQLQNGTKLMHHIALRKNGNHLSVLAMHLSLTNLDEVAAVIPEGVPVVLVLTGKGVLLRYSSASSETSNEKLIHSVFPDSRADDFLLSTELRNENGLLLCLTRTLYAETMVKEFLSRKIQITEVCIGPLAICGILSMLDPVNSPVLTGQYSFHHTNGQLIDVQPKVTEVPADVRVGQIPLPGLILCSFAAAFNFMIINHCNATTLLALVRESAQKIKLFSKVNRIIAISLVSLFIILIVNFFAFNLYTNKYDRLNSVVQEDLWYVKRTDSLKELILQREQFLKHTSGTGSRKSSFIIDRISACIPADIALADITVHPILFKEDDSKKEPVYQPNTIRICARIKESGELNRWIKQLEELNWVESVAFSDYRAKEDDEAGVTLVITTR